VEHHDVVVEHHDHVECKRSLLGRLVDFDHRVSAWVHEQGLGIFFYVFLRTLEFSGDSVFLIPCAAAAFLAPPQRLTPEVRMFFFNLFMTFIFDLIFVSIVKKMVRRPRPAYNRAHFRALQVDHWSFPSGHSTRALITTTLFALYLPMWKDQARRIWTPFLVNQLKGHVIILKHAMPTAESLLVSAIALTITAWAVATTTSRIILGRHFLCDVLAGSVIGIGEALFAHRYLFIPMKTSEYIHSAVNQSFAWIEDSIYNSFHSRTFVITHVKPR
jgi:membrane-associated phospholipid phosphatase